MMKQYSITPHPLGIDSAVKCRTMRTSD